MSIKSVKVNISRKKCPNDPSVQKLGSQVKRCALQLGDGQTDRHESENRGHPFRVSGLFSNFPSTYHQGAAQSSMCSFKPDYFISYMFCLVENQYTSYKFPSLYSPEPVEPPPKTYTTRDKFEYFKPSVQVELDNNDKWDTVTEMFIRGKKGKMMLKYNLKCSSIALLM